jgi:hypothetical protein
MKIEKNKKAWLKIVEAIFAIMIVGGIALIILSNGNRTNETADIVHEKQNQILNMISKNDSLRDIILNPTSEKEENPKIKEKILLIAPNNWEFKTKICNINGNCTTAGISPDKEVYVKEVVIYSIPNSTKLRFWVWIKE